MQLDARQRAMLLEMGVRVWSPVQPPDADAAPAPAPAERSVAAQAAALPSAHAHVGARRDSPGTPVPAPPAARTNTASPQPAATTTATTPPSTTSASRLPLPERAAAIAQMDWDTLQQTVGGCRACALCEARRHTVFGVGQPQPPVDWLIVGEAPGEREDALGEPFVGPAGQLLDAMLQAIGLNRHNEAAQHPNRADRQTVFLSNVLKCRPPGNRNPQVDEIAQCRPYLERQIALLQPRLILALGRFAAQAVLAPTLPQAMTLPLGKLRGQAHRYGATGIPVVVSYHPAYLLRNLPDKAKSWADLVLAMQVLRDAPPR